MKHLKIILLFIGVLLYSQEYNFSYNYVNYNINNGFSSSEVFYGLKDSRNFMWFTTDKGISRFNGLEFKTFTVKDGLSDNNILGCYEDDAKNIWFYASNFTLNVYDIKTNRINPYLYNSHLLKQHFGSSISALFVKNNLIYLIFKNYGYAIIDKKGKISIQNNKVVYDKEKGFYKFQDSLLIPVVWNGRKLPVDFKVYFTQFKNNEISCNENWTAFIKDEFNVTTINNKTSEIDVFNSPELINSITLNTLNSNELLISTESGLVKYFFKNKESISYLKDFHINYTIGNTNAGFFALTKNNGLFNIKNNEVLTLYKNKDKYTKPITNLFIINGKLNVILDPDNEILEFSDYTFSSSNSLQLSLKEIISLKNKTFITPISVSINNDIASKPLSELKIISITEHHETTYLLTEQGFFLLKDKVLQKIDQLTPLTYNAKSIAYFNNQLWIGTLKGLYSFKNNKVEEVKLLNPNHNSIQTLKNYKNQNLIVGTTNFGLYFINSNHKITAISEENGLISNIINDLIIVDNTIWVTTNLGINLISDTKKKFLITDSFSLSDGLNSTDPTCITEIDKNVYVGSKYGLNLIKPYQKYKNNLKVYIDHILLNSKQVKREKNIVFPNKSSIEFSFILNSFNSINPKIFYRIPGLNDDFKEAKNLNVILESIPSGSYTIEFYAKDYIEETPIQKQSFEIETSFFARWYLILILSALFCFILYKALKFYFKKMEEKYKKQEEINRYKLLAFNKQMSSHFISNSFNAINNFILKNDNVGGSKYLSRMSKLFRHSLQATEKSYIPFNQEIEAITSYIELEKLRYNDSFSYEIHIGEDLQTKNISIIPLVLQTLIENAIWHGLLPSTQKEKKITLNIKKSTNANLLLVEIIDNGIGINSIDLWKEKSKGIQLVKAIIQTNTYAKNLNPENILKFVNLTEQDENKGTICSLYLPFIIELK